MSTSTSPAEALAEFFDKNLIVEILYEVKSGKEATVYCCRAGSAAPVPLLAAKLYHQQERRNFHNDAVYREGTVILNARDRRAAAKKTRFGREFLYGAWVQREWETLCLLYNAGAAVPQPVACAERALLLEFIGDEERPAQQLNRVAPGREEAEAMSATLLGNVELWLACDRVHADLSPFNILYHEGRVTVIDFPQAVDSRFHPSARALLQRDVENLCRYFDRRGVYTNAAGYVDDLWERYRRAELSPISP